MNATGDTRGPDLMHLENAARALMVANSELISVHGWNVTAFRKDIRWIETKIRRMAHVLETELEAEVTR